MLLSINIKNIILILLLILILHFFLSILIENKNKPVVCRAEVKSNDMIDYVTNGEEFGQGLNISSYPQVDNALDKAVFDNGLDKGLGKKLDLGLEGNLPEPSVEIPWPSLDAESYLKPLDDVEGELNAFDGFDNIYQPYFELKN